MGSLQLKNVHFTYPEAERKALDGVSFDVHEGEFVLICGPSGCGKTTLLRLLKKDMDPVGHREGDIRYDGIPIHQLDSLQAVQLIGMVSQDPDNQIVMEEVWQELVFGLENLGYSTETMRKRVAEMVHFFGLESLMYRKTHELSGGQKQLLNLASVLLQQPRVLLLDEPTAQLDPISAHEFIKMVQRINEELGITVILVEHRHEEIFPLVDQVLVLHAGKVEHAGSPRQVAQDIWLKQKMVFYLPSVSRLFLQGGKAFSHSTLPMTVKEGRKQLQDFSFHMKGRQLTASFNDSLLEAKELIFGYDRDFPPILQRLSLTVRKNEFLTILGGNGAGKSTLLQVLAGILSPQKGDVHLEGQKIKKWKPEQLYRKVGYLAQNPLLYFIHDTVEQELQHVIQRFAISDGAEKMKQILHTLGIEYVRSMHPHDCSGGERQKAALACLLLSKPDILLLDEPTKGLDPYSKQQLGAILNELHLQGMTIVMVTHDVEFAARYSTRCAMLFEGRMTAEGSPQTFFAGNFFYTTMIHRLLREVLPEAITEEEVLVQCIKPKSFSCLS